MKFKTFSITYGIVIITALVLLNSCAKDTLETDAELIPYFEIFAEEAAKRGIVVDYESARIEGLMQNISESNVLGQCFRNEEKPKKVIIDIDYWNSVDELRREFLIFHELGHCFLNRDHDDSEDQNGVCRSIMHSTPDACNFTLTNDNKEDYLDELFGT